MVVPRSTSVPMDAAPVGAPCSPSDVRDVLGDGVEGRMAIDLVGARCEEGVLLVRAGCGDGFCPYHPDAHTLVAAGVEVAGGVQSHPLVGGVRRGHAGGGEGAFVQDGE